MVKAQTTKQQAKIARETGCALFAYACKSGGTISCDGPISHGIAKSLAKLMSAIIADRVPEQRLADFVESLIGEE